MKRILLMFLLLIGAISTATTLKKQPIPSGSSVPLTSLEVRGIDKKHNCISGYCEVSYTELRVVTKDGKLFTDITWPTTLPKIYVSEGVIKKKKAASPFEVIAYMFEPERDGITKSITAVKSFTELRVE